MTIAPLPANPSLEFDKKQAKKLLDQWQRGEPAATQRFRSHHPRFARLEPRGAALHDAQLVVAREYGFASWPRWKEFVESRRLDLAARADELVRAACNANMRTATTLLAAEPSLSGFDLITAVTTGDVARTEHWLASDPKRVSARGGPNGWQPIVYACFSRFLRSDPERAAGIVQAVRLLLAHGADPNSHFWSGEDQERHVQTCLYAAAGIANNAQLTRLLLEAGATVQGDDGELLYHACEFQDVTCLGLVLEACPPPPAETPDPRKPAHRVSYCLSRALDFDNEAAALLFLEHGADPNLRVPWHEQRTHMHKAAIKGRSVATLSAMLDRGGDFRLEDAHGVSAYRYAVRFGHQHLVRLFEARGADPGGASAEDRALGGVVSGEPEARRIDALSSADLLHDAAWLGNSAALRRLLDAGADPNQAAHLPALHAACWTGQLEAARLLVDRGASLSAKNGYGGDALGATLHGSTFCADPEGGPGMKLPEEVHHGQYAEIADMLLSRGAPRPARIDGGSEAVQEVLRRHGVRDPD